MENAVVNNPRERERNGKRRRGDTDVRIAFFPPSPARSPRESRAPTDSVVRRSGAFYRTDAPSRRTSGPRTDATREKAGTQSPLIYLGAAWPARATKTETDTAVK